MKTLLTGLVLLCACLSTSFRTDPAPAMERLLAYTVIACEEYCDCTADFTEVYIFSPESCPCQRLTYCLLIPACCKDPEDLCAWVEMDSVDENDGQCDCVVKTTVIGQQCCIDVTATVYEDDCCTTGCTPRCCNGPHNFTLSASMICDDSVNPEETGSGGSVTQTFGVWFYCDDEEQIGDGSTTIGCQNPGVYPGGLGSVKAKGTCICTVPPHRP